MPSSTDLKQVVKKADKLLKDFLKDLEAIKKQAAQLLAEAHRAGNK